MARSISKGPYIEPSLLDKVRKVLALSKSENNLVSKYPIYTKARSSVIFDAMCNMIVFIHDGKDYVKVTIKEEMLGYKLGSLVPTRYFGGHKSSKEIKGKGKGKKFGR